MVKLEEMSLRRLIKMRDEIEEEVAERKQSISGSRKEKNMLYHQIETREIMIKKLNNTISSRQNELHQQTLPKEEAEN